MQQASIFDIEPHTLSRRSDPITSKNAAKRVGEFASTHHDKILEAMANLATPAGAEQIAAYSRIDAYQVRKRMPELARAGVVEALELMRPTTSGRFERLWRLK